MVKMRAKLKVVSVVASSVTYETVVFRAIGRSDSYPADGSDENSTFSKFTPSADMTMGISNPDLIGKFFAGQEFYVDFTPVAPRPQDPPDVGHGQRG